MSRVDVVVVGAGIVGLAHALAAARRGLSVALIDRADRSVGVTGASVRNFGMVWPVGQGPPALHRRAMRSREVWLELSTRAGFFCSPCGSLHAAYYEDEEAVLRECLERFGREQRGGEWLSPAATLQRSPGLKRDGLRGAMFSASEACVDPREAIRVIPGWLREAMGVELAFGSPVTRVEPGLVMTADGGGWSAGHVVVCPGDDLRTLFPEALSDCGLQACKLQMLRTAAQPGGWRMGPHLAAGLTLRHYPCFRECPSLPALAARLEQSMPRWCELGIHVVVAQNGLGELVIGDSHQYGGAAAEPFDQEEIDGLIMAYLREFFGAPDLRIAQRWHGVYAKQMGGATAVIRQPLPGVWIVTGAGGMGMTLSLGLAEETLAALVGGGSPGDVVV